MYLRLCGVLTALLAFGAPLGADDKKADPIDAKKLVGKWQAKDREKSGFPPGAVIEFLKDGKFAMTFDDDGVMKRSDGTYAVDGDQVKLVLKGSVVILPDGTQKKTEEPDLKATVTVVKLTDTELTIVNQRKRETAMVRVKDKK
jgi:uncharacterized protein (TIGR03066 family)